MKIFAPTLDNTERLYILHPVNATTTKPQGKGTVDTLSDDEILQAVYADYQDKPLVMELAKRLEQAHERAAEHTTPKGN